MVTLPGHGHISDKIRAAGSRRSSAATNSNRSSVDGANLGGNGNEDDETVVEPEQGNVLSHIISQLRPGADLSRVTLPTFILEPRSMLERITNFMAHPETLLPMSTIDDPTERFISVVKFYLSGWHIRPPGVKKPLNPILGETYTCFWDYPDNTKGYYISEQTSHHPPKSSYFFMAPEHHIRIDGTLKPNSKFLGNSVASEMKGIAVLRILNKGKGPSESKGPRGEKYFKPGGEKYILTQPDMYARGILFGKMKYELGGHLIVQCPELDMIADVEFKTKGWVGGTYNAIGGNIKKESTGAVLYEFSGKWNEQMYITDARTKQRTLLYDAMAQKPTPPSVRPLEEQNERESQKLWHSTVQAVIAGDHETATDQKSQIENMQREEAAKRLADGVDFRPRYFRPVKCGPGESEDVDEERLDWILAKDIDGREPEEQVKQILSIAPIIKGQDYHERMPIPPSRHSRQSMESLRSEKSHARQISENDAPASAPAQAAPAANSFNASQQQQQQMPTIPQAQNEGDLVDYGNVGQNERPVPRDIETPHPTQSSAQAQGYIHTQEPALVQQPVPQHPAQTQAPLQEVQPPINMLNPAPPSNVRVIPEGSAVPVPEDLAHAQTANGGQAQRELEEQLRASESTPKPHAGALKDFHNEMRESLPGAGAARGGLKPPMQREESGASTDSSDFVDAKSTLSNDTVR